MNLPEWIEKKRDQLQRLRTPDVRHLVPSLKDFTHAVSTRREVLAIVAEIARATPEEGPLAAEINIVEIVQGIDASSVSAIAIATDEVACAGSPSDLFAAARATSSPVIARDLILAREQLYLLRLLGADAVLLTAAAISPVQTRSLIEISSSMHMAAPVEVRSEAELSTSISAGAKLLVIPAFAAGRLSLSLADTLLPKVPRGATVLVRGPFASPNEFENLRRRADGIWIAGPLMRAKDPGTFVAHLVHAAEKS